jgi:hypothetical protein
MGMKTRGGLSNGIYLAGNAIEHDHRIRKKWNELQEI